MKNRFLLSAVFLVLLTSGFLQASDQFKLDPVKVFEGSEASPWARVECLVDEHKGFTQEAFSRLGKQTDPLIIKWFGGIATPHSGNFLLHCAKDYNKKTFPNPVLLIHGAADNANRSWIHPWVATNPAELPSDKQGFAIKLSDLGYAVFAITFSHNQGDNFFQAEQVANAIRRIRKLLGRENDPSFKVDIIAHSKGNVSARLYCSDSRSMFPGKTFLSHFRKDVRKFIAIASPFRGIDVSFRYYAYNLYLALQKEVNAPFGADKLLVYGSWKDVSSETPFRSSKNLWPGQSQLLYNLVRDAGVYLDAQSCTPDANISSGILYFGGRSTILVSRGIDRAIEEGERLIYKLEEKGLCPEVSLGVLAGYNPYIDPVLKKMYLPHVMVPFVHPSDGVIFLESSTYLDGVLKRGSKLLGKELLDLNHLDLARDPKTLRIVDDYLLQK